ncbi:MAG: 30S ribosomal protein S2, partial [bacterium]|nr:30S ribosomal protein S2 [bacterium]
PELLIVIDPVIHMTAIREARHLNIPVVAFTNTDANPDVVNYLVPGNTKTRTSINWFVEKLSEAVKEGKAAAALAVQAEAAKAPAPAAVPEKK